MVAIVAGKGLGLERTSAYVLGSAGRLGDPTLGRADDNVFVNAATGNLVIERLDEMLMGVGPDVTVTSTYNSLGALNDDNGDNWRPGATRQLVNLTGTYGAVGSTITRIDWDGSDEVYTCLTTNGPYVCKDGAGAYDSLTRGGDGVTWTWTDGATQLTETYDMGHSGRITLQTDTDGNSLAFTYAGNLLSRVTTSDGQYTRYDYNASSQLTQVVTKYTDSSGGFHTATRVMYAYDASDRLIKVTVDLSPTDNATTDGAIYEINYGYDGTSNRVNLITQTDGSKLQITYDTSNRVASYTQTAGTGDLRTTSFNYVSGRTDVTDPFGKVTKLYYDSSNQLTQITKPAAASGLSQQVFTFTYDSDGNVLTIAPPSGAGVTYAYDSATGNRQWEMDALGDTIRRTYGSKNELLTETRYLGPDPDHALPSNATLPRTTRYVYDGENHLRYKITDDGRVTQYIYTGAGKQRSVIEYTASFYDTSGLTATQSPSESTVDAWVSGTADKSAALRTDIAYDWRENIDTVTTFETVANSGAGVTTNSSTLHYVYDYSGKLLLRQLVGNSATEAYVYDGLWRLTSSTDFNGKVTLTSYADATRTDTVTLANGSTQISIYDKAGELITFKTAATGMTTAVTSYTYDARGRLRSATDPTGVVTYTIYDSVDRKAADIGADGVMTEYKYDLDDQLVATVTYNTPLTSANLTTVAILFDSGGNPVSPAVSSIRPAANAADRWSWLIYDAAHRLVQSIDAIGAVTNYVYDGHSRLTDSTSYATLLSSTLVSGFKTTLPSTPVAVGTNASINVIADANNDRVSRNFYDDDGYLIGTLDAEGYLTEFVYDGAGQKVETVGYATVTPSANRAAGTFTTLRSNVTATTNADDIHSYFVYDARGNLRGAIDGEGALTRYEYDAMGNLSQEIRGQEYASPPPFATRPKFADLATVPTESVLETTIYSRDLYGHVLTETKVLASGNEVTTYTYNDLYQVLTKVTASVDPVTGQSDARTLTFRYDAKGRLTGQLSGEGSAALAVAGADPATVYGTYGIVYAYDDADRLIAKTEPDGADATGDKTLYYYNANNQLTHVVNALGEVVEHRYDAFGERADVIAYGTRISTTGLTGGLVTTGLTSAVAAVANSALDSETHTDYNLTGTVADVVDAMQATTTFAYNAFGDMTSETDPIQGAATTTTTRSYDRRSLLRSVVQDAGTGLLNLTTTYDYDAFGREVRSVDANGNATSATTDGVRTATYYRTGRVHTRTDALGNTTTFTYDARGNVLTVKDRENNTTTYSYNAFERTITVTTAEGIGTTTKVNAYGQTASVTDGASRTTTYKYDRDGNVTFVTDGGSNQVHNYYDEAGRLEKTVDAAGVTVTFNYDAAGRVSSRKVDPTGLALVTSYAYDAKGQQVTVTNPDNCTTKIDYDLDGRRVQVTTDSASGGLQLKTGYQYDKRGKVITVTDAVGTAAERATKYSYDNAGRLTATQVDPTGLNLTTTYNYDQNGNVIDRTEPGSAVTRYIYDQENRQIYSIDPLGEVTATTYDKEGRVASTRRYYNTVSTTTLNGWTTGTAVTVAQLAAAAATSTSNDELTSYVYDKDGRLRFVVDATSHVVEYVYDGAGNVIHKTQYADAVTGSGPYTIAYFATNLTTDGDDRTTRAIYDGANRQVYSIDGEGAVTAFAYDGAGNVTKRVTYDAFYTTTGDQAKATLDSWVSSHPNGRVERSVYDAAGRVVYKVDGEGYVTEYRYDPAGRVNQQISYAASYTVNDGVTQASLKAQLPATVPSSAVSILYYYDKAGRLTSEVLPVSSTVNGSVQATTVTNTYEYDGRGNRTKTIEASNISSLKRTTTYEYDDADRLTKATGDQVTVTTSTSTGFSTTNNVAPIQTYEYDSRGNLTKTTDASGASTWFWYDKLNRKTTEVDATGAVRKYSYDSFGNVTSVKSYNTLATVPPASEPAGSGGNREIQYQYDSNNRVTKVIQPSLLVGSYGATYSSSTKNVTVQYFYNAMGEVVRQLDGRGFNTYVFYDNAGGKIAQVDGENYLTFYTLNSTGNVTKEERFAAAITSTVSTSSNPNTLRTNVAKDAAKDRITDFTYDRTGRRLTEKRENVASSTVNATSGALTSSSPDATVTYAYDAFGNVTRKTEATGDYTDYTYDKLGRVLTATLSAYTDYQNNSVRRETDYDYDGLGDVTRVTVGAVGAGASAQRITNYVYGAGGRLSTMTDAASFTHTYGYDEMGRVTKDSYDRQQSDGTTITEAVAYRYDALGRMTFQATAAKPSTTWNYTASSWMKYNAFGEMTGRGMNNSGGSATYQESFDYDDGGRLWRTNSGDGSTKLFVYDENGNATLAITSDGYDLSGFTNVSTALGHMTTAGVFDIAAVATFSTFDGRNLNLSTVEPDRELAAGAANVAITHSRAYTAFGEVASETDGRGYTTDYTYNTEGRLTQKKAPTVSVTAEDGGQSSVRPTDNYAYDVSGRLVGVQDANGNWTTRQLLGGSGYGGEEAIALQEFHADTGVARIGVDVFGDERKFTNELGKIETRDYDKMGRLITLTRPTRTAAGSPAVLVEHYDYDGLGQRLLHWNSQLTSSVKETTDYDSQGRVIKTVDFGTVTTTTTYAFLAGTATTGLGTFGAWKKSATVNGGTTVDYTDYFGHTVEHYDIGNHDYTFTFDKAGRTVSRVGQFDTDGNGTPDTSIGHIDYSWFNTGQLASIVDSSGTVGGYGTGQLTSTFKYDKDGHRTFEKYSNTTTTAESATVAYDALGRMTSYTDTARSQPVINYEYDATGNVRRVQSTYVDLVTSTSTTTDYWYKYDSMNRMVLAKGAFSGARGSGTISRAHTGVGMAYDVAGQRTQEVQALQFTESVEVSADHWENVTFWADQREDFTYAEDGYLLNVKIAHGHYLPGGTITSPGTGILRSEDVRDSMGRVTTHTEYQVDQDDVSTVAYSRVATYDAKSRVTHDVVSWIQSDGSNAQSTSDYDYKLLSGGTYSGLDIGVTTHSHGSTTVTPVSGSATTTTQDTIYGYSWWDSAQQDSISYDPDTGVTGVNNTTYSYDANGHLKFVDIHDGQPRTITYLTDANGQILDRTASSSGPKEQYYYFNGMRVGDVGNDGPSDTDYATAINQRSAPPQQGAFKTGSAVSFSDFDQAYDPINPSNGGEAQTAERYTVHDGDTLQSIAAQIWGDSSLWYKLADANGLSGDESLTVGSTLYVPNKVTNAHNTSSTFKPYDPNEAIGSVDPTRVAQVKPNQHHGCGVIGQILVVIIAVAVTIATHGLLAHGALSALGTALGGVGTAAVSGAAGSIASQGFAVATGVQDSFSWKGVALAALSAGVAQGLDKVVPGAIGGSKLLGDVVRGAAGNAITQGVAVATGLQDKFDWTGVAVGGVVGGVFGAVSRSFEHAHPQFPHGSLVNKTLSGAAGAIAGAVTRSLVDGTDFGDNILATLPDVIGTAIGSVAGDQLDLQLQPHEWAADKYLQLAAVGMSDVPLYGSAQPKSGWSKFWNVLTHPSKWGGALHDLIDYTGAEVSHDFGVAENTVAEVVVTARRAMDWVAQNFSAHSSLKPRSGSSIPQLRAAPPMWQQVLGGAIQDAGRTWRHVEGDFYPRTLQEQINVSGDTFGLKRLGDLTQVVGSFGGGLLRPLFPDSNDAVADQIAAETNRAHPFPLDPNHVHTPQEQREFLAQIALGVATFKFGLPELDGGGPLAETEISLSDEVAIGANSARMLSTDELIAALRSANGAEADQYARILAERSTHVSGDADRVVIGRFDPDGGGYIGEARANGGIWYQTEDGFYDKLTSGLEPEAARQIAWKVNEQFLQTQMENGVGKIDLVGDVSDVLVNRAESFTALEIRYIESSGWRYGYERVGNSWIKVR